MEMQILEQDWLVADLPHPLPEHLPASVVSFRKWDNTPKVIMRIRKEYMLSSRNIAMSKPHKSVYYSNHSLQKESNMDVSD